MVRNVAHNPTFQYYEPPAAFHTIVGCHPRLWRKRFITLVVLMATFILFTIILHSHPSKVNPNIWPKNQTRNAAILIHPNHETAMMRPETVCHSAAGNDSVYLVVAVSSSLQKPERRSAIRRSWGRDQQTLRNVKVIFVVGKQKNQTIAQNDLVEEGNVYKDILQEDFIDNYTNLTIKTLHMLKWFNNNCKDVPYLFKTDEDVYINLMNLYQFVQKNKDPYLIAGSRICGARPVSDIGSKYYCPPYMFSARYYPPYVSGTAYVMTSASAGILYQTALTTPIFHMEDIFITGIVREVINNGGQKLSALNSKEPIKLLPKDDARFSIVMTRLNPCIYSQIISSHHLSIEEMTVIHQGVIQVRTGVKKCRILKPSQLRPYPPDKCSWKEKISYVIHRSTQFFASAKDNLNE